MIDTSAAGEAYLVHLGPRTDCYDAPTNSHSTAIACYWTVANWRDLGRSQDAIDETKSVHRLHRANFTPIAVGTDWEYQLILWHHKSWSSDCVHCSQYRAIAAVFADETVVEIGASEAFLWLWYEQDYLGPHHPLQATTIIIVVNWRQQCSLDYEKPWALACWIQLIMPNFATAIMVQQGIGQNSIVIDLERYCFHRPAKTNSHWL